MQIIHRLFLSALLAVVLFSCAKDPVTPEVNMISPNEGNVFTTNSSIVVQAMLADGLIIDQYKVQLRLSSPSEVIDSTSDLIYFADSAYLYVSGQSYNQNSFQHVVNIGADFTPGSYYLVVAALNSQYNEGKDTLNISIVNVTDSVAPVVNVTLPAGASSFHKLDTLDLFAVCTDVRTNLSAGVIRRIKVTIDPVFSGQAAVDVVNEFLPQSDTVNAQYVIPNSFNTGSYIVRYTVLDEFNNAAIREISITVN